MLAKVPAKRNDGKSSFKSLHKYIVRRDKLHPDTEEKIGWVQDVISTQTNCLHTETAWREMLAVADMNGRVKDPVYHLVISWQKDEKPTDLQTYEACKDAIKAIGMQDHQYVVAIHRDTDNHHAHLMVNRVNPDTYKSVYPDRDFYILDRTMREIELRQGWRHDNGPFAVHPRDGINIIDWTKPSSKEYHKGKSDKRSTKIKDMERFTGNESLHTYAQGDPKKDSTGLLNSPDASWKMLHLTLAKHGLEIRPTSEKNNTFRVHSIASRELCIKASAMGLGGGKLLKQLGVFELFEQKAFDKELPVKRNYSKHRSLRDPNKRVENRERRARERAILREKYDVFISEWTETKAPVKAELLSNHKSLKKTISDKYKAEREEILKSGLDAEQRKALRLVAALNVATQRYDLKIFIKAENAKYKKKKRPLYCDWVADLAGTGDPAAIAQLRGFVYADKRKDKRPTKPEQTLAPDLYFTTDAESYIEVTRPIKLSERVTWVVDRSTGAVNYLVNNRLAFRDEGRHIIFNKTSSSDAESIVAGLILAKEKFGAVDVYGTSEFKQRVLSVAIEQRLDMKFSNPEFEQKRRHAVNIDINQSLTHVIVDRSRGRVIEVRGDTQKARLLPSMTREESMLVLSSLGPVRDYVEVPRFIPGQEELESDNSTTDLDI